nr:response regulator transcription factor [Marinilactibacillus kalidii]
MLVEDEAILREISKDYFLSEGYSVLEAENGLEALALFNTHTVDLIVLDIMMPKFDGWSVCKTIRKRSSVPIIMLTARSDEEDTIVGFELGADDYVTKPYNPKILLARANRLLNATVHPFEQLDQTKTLKSGLIEIDLQSRSVAVEQQLIDLTHTEFEILVYLMKNKNIVISREQMIVKIWGYEYLGADRTINTHMRNLRKKLGDAANQIKTIVRTGYKFEGN